MKRTKCLLALFEIVVLLLTTGCEQKEPDSGLNEYALCIKYEIDKTHKDSETLRSKIEAALLSIGFQSQAYETALKGDKVAVTAQVTAKMQAVETAIKECRSDCYVKVTVSGILKKDLEEQNNNIVRFYRYTSGVRKVSENMEGLYNCTGHIGRWVKCLKSDEGYYYDEEGDYFTQCGFDMNQGADGEDLYLMLEHSGKNGDNSNAFEWEEQFADTYLTDVIAIYGGNEPTSIVIDGRTYYKQTQVRDLNRGSGGNYIYLYGTTDPVKGFEGYYLNTGGLLDEKFGDYQCRMLSSDSEFDAEAYRNEPFTWGAHRFVERVVQAYNTDGSYAGQLNANAGVEDSDCIRFIFTYARHEDKKFDYAHWTEALPGSTRLSELTIPGLHDAATWSADWDLLWAATLKDQDLDYATAWDRGARVFDMRLGYSSGYGEFADGCAFYHGDFADVFCRLNQFYDDIPNHFPTKEQVNSSFMILISKIEFPNECENKLNIFEYFMRLLIDRYGTDCFIEYREGLTLDDLKGKIIMFVEQDELTENYSKIGKLTQVPINKLCTTDKSPVEIKTFVEGKATGNTYQATVQNVWKVDDANEKYQHIQAVLKQPVPELLINQFNATDCTGLHMSWSISKFLNRMICNDLAKIPLPSQYQRPLGIVLLDFCGTETYAHNHDFAGDTLTKWLIEHNFRNK